MDDLEPGEATPLAISVSAPATYHEVTIRQLEKWIVRTATSPDETLLKSRVRELSRPKAVSTNVISFQESPPSNSPYNRVMRRIAIFSDGSKIGAMIGPDLVKGLGGFGAPYRTPYATSPLVSPSTATDYTTIPLS